MQQEQQQPQPQTETEATPEPQDAVTVLATQLGEDPTRLKKRTDMATVLRRMQEGVIIRVHLSRPRFAKTINVRDLGLEVTSREAQQVIDSYFSLGRRSLLPPDLQRRLAANEAQIRYNLQQHAIKSHWGAFVPRTSYQSWKEEHEKLEQEFWDLRTEIVEHYEAITARVIEDARPLAEDAWRRVTLGKALLEQGEDTVTREILTELVERLRDGQGKETFIANYLQTIAQAIPEKEEIEDAFLLEVERSVVPLPSLVARDMENADRIYRERALEDARTRAQLEEIERQRRAEHEASYERLRKEREQQRLQAEMERDVLNDARRQKERLVQEFYSEVVGQINSAITEVTGNVLDSLEKNNGTIRGRVSLQLRNLVRQLEQLNFIEDEQIESQVERLRSVLPTREESEKAARGLAKINTTRIETVVRAIHKEASSIQIDLETQPRTRTKRTEEPLHPVTFDATHRQARPGTVLAEDAEISSEAPSKRQKRTL